MLSCERDRNKDEDDDKEEERREREEDTIVVDGREDLEGHEKSLSLYPLSTSFVFSS